MDHVWHCLIFFFFFFNDTATTEIYTLSLHDALPISARLTAVPRLALRPRADDADLGVRLCPVVEAGRERERSEEHTSELQSRQYLVCRLLLEKKKTTYTNMYKASNSCHTCRI